MQDTGTLKVVVKINGAVDELVNIRKKLLIGFVEGEDDVVIEVDKGNGILRQAVGEDRK